MASEWERLYEEARRLHQQGRLDDALALYQKIVSGHPGHGGAMHMLGLIAYQVGRTDTAVDLLRQAAVLDPLVGTVHSNLGLALMARGRMAAAEESFRRALLLSPQPQTHTSLGQLLLEQGRLEDAAASFRAALAGNTELADAQAGLGETLWKLGRIREAEAAYERAAQLSPSGDIQANLALLAFARRDPATALTRIGQALAAGETPRARQVFITIATQLHFERDDPAIRALLARALEEGWARPELLLLPAADLVKLGLRAGARLEDDALLLQMLASGPIPDPELETVLTALRRQLLAQPENRDLSLSAALALQCHLNEYVFAEEEAEHERARALAREIEAALASDEVISATALLAVACYMPLGALKGADRLLKRAWPDPLEPVLRQQIQEPVEDRERGALMPALTPVDEAAPDEISPRWAQMEIAGAPVTLAAWLGRRFPAFDAGGLPLSPEMLFAGCGTGRFMLELSRRHPAASRFAIDTGRERLGHAARRAAEAGLDIAFAQAEPLRLPDTKKRFAAILADEALRGSDPFAAWEALAACLLPGGVMRMALHSQTGRLTLAPVRERMAQQGFAAGDVRAARGRLLAEKPETARPLLASADFYRTAGCRELLFPSLEHAVTLSALAAFLKEAGLTFLGFETSEEVLAAYRGRFPDDLAATSLDNWAALEASHPVLFAGVYRFWVQKP